MTARAKMNWLAILGVAIPIVTSTLVYANMMGRQAEAVQQLGVQFTDFKKDFSAKMDGVQTTLSVIQTEVRHNTELNKEQVDAYKAELIALKVVNKALKEGKK